LARRFTTLDILSGGRSICGLGIGWSKDEYQDSNIPYERISKRADEYVQLIKKIWTADIVEFKGEYYNIPASKIGPKPIQKPHIPICLSAVFSPNAFRRIVKYDANGWIGVVFGPLDNIENSIKTIRQEAIKTNKDPNNFKLVLLTYPNIVDSKSQSTNEGQRFLLTGTIDQAGNDIKRIKDMGINHIIFGYNFLPRDPDMMLDITKQLSEFAK
jgi:alkanesulfonate monooxygenase SsuD/methylene tetrahydromethanopterin reductase-like flavin-dependent oxidoreductase (luciferase family)